MSLLSPDYLSISFFFALCITTVFYFLMPNKWQLSMVSIATFIFLLLLSPLSCAWLSMSTLLVGLSLRYKKTKTGLLILIISLVFLLNQYFTQPLRTDIIPTSILFLGIAYYTCRHIHVLVECYKGKIHEVSLINYIHYIFFLPVIVNGPINRYLHFIRACQRRCFSYEHLFQSLERILYGYAKVIIIGNYFLNLQVTLWLHRYLTQSFFSQLVFSANSWCVLYAVFSGYTDIALGFSKIWGFTIEENFNRPYLAKNLIEFWQRWHITLSQWCKDYIYLPMLAYSRTASFSVICAMIGIGLWHQLSVFYLFWASYQALGIILCRVYQRRDFLQLHKLPLPLQHAITRVATFGWLFSAKPIIILLVTQLWKFS